MMGMTRTEDLSDAEWSRIEPLLPSSAGRPRPGRLRTRPARLLADKGYSSRANRDLLRRRGIPHTIPEPRDQANNRRRRGSQGGRPVGFSAATYRNRKVVERCFNRLKQWRGLATRTDKHAHNYQGGLLLASALLWAPPDPADTS
jgi:transposase